MTATITKTEMHRLGRDSNLKVGDVVFAAYRSRTGMFGMPDRIYEITIENTKSKHPLAEAFGAAVPVFTTGQERLVREDGKNVVGESTSVFISLKRRADLDAGEFPGYGLFATLAEAEHFIEMGAKHRRPA